MNRKNALLLAVTAAIAVTAAVILLPRLKRSPEPAPVSVPAATASQRIDYFALHGWEVEEIAEKAVTIPEKFSPAYEEYAIIQDKQGLPLRDYAGRVAQLYVYTVRNYAPEGLSMLAELLVCDNTAVASLVYSDDGGSVRLPIN